MPRKMPGYAGKMREKSKAIPSRFPFENILCRFSIALDTPTPTWHSGTFIVLVVLIFLFVCCCFFVCLPLSHSRSTIAACSPMDKGNK